MEGAVLLLLSVVLYNPTGGSWLLFVLLFLVPDLSLLGYLSGPRTGAVSYNLFHTYVLPGLLAALGLSMGGRCSYPWPWYGSPTSGSTG